MKFLTFMIFLVCFWMSLEWCPKFNNTELNQIISVSHSMDGFYLAVTIKNTNVKIYSMITLKLVSTITFGSSVPQKVRFSKDGKYLAIAYNSNNVQILNALEPFGSNLTLGVNHGTTYDIDFDSTGNLFVSCGSDNKVKLWTVVHGGAWTFLKQTTSLSGTMTTCRFSPNNSYISITTSSNIYIYTSPNLVFTYNKGRNSAQAAWSLDGSRVYSATLNNNVYQYVMSNFGQTTINGGTNYNTVDVSNDGNNIMMGGNNKILYFFNQTNFNHTMIYQFPFTGNINDAKFSNDSKTFAVGLDNKNFYVYTANCMTYCESGTIYNSSTNSCDKCSKTISNCSICYNSSYCYQCQVGFYQNTQTKLCSLCNVMEGCSICSAYNNCTSCAPGYTLNSSFLCQKCSIFMIGCNQCNSTSTCDSCVNEYYLDSNNKCVLCQLSTQNSMNNCLRCTSNSNCIQCMPGFYANSGDCNSCVDNCLYCENSSNNCSQCTLGYYVNPPTLYTCTACPYGCISCNATTCFDCWAQMYEAPDGTCKFCPFPCTTCQNTTYCQKCIDHYFLNQSDHTCYRCQNNCNTCNSTTYCVSCFEGYYLKSDNTCQLCSNFNPYCTQCNSTGCILCAKGFYYSSTANQCVKCISTMYQCVTCVSATGCRQCTIGYYLNGTNSGNSSCLTCPLSCQECSSSSVCTKCYQGFYLQTSNNTCMSCETKYCTQCIASNQCTFCEIGYYLQAATNTCQICTILGCYSCTEVSAVQQCVLCLPGYYLDTSSMVCKECNASCTTCLASSTQCTSCAIGYYLDSTAQSCNICPMNCSQCMNTTSCTSCTYGYYLTSTNSCVLCTAKFNTSCLNCNATNCLICKGGFYLANTTTNTPPQICIGCNVTDIFCLQCNSTACSKCSDGAYLNTLVTPNKCKTCSLAMQGCLSCSSSNTCTKCQNGYFLNGTSNTCVVCPMGCELCTSSTVCLRCNSHYYFQPSNTSCVLCQSLINGCSQCPTQTLCQLCLNGYYLQTINSTFSTCNYCSQSIVGCQYCNSSTICTKCMTQYYLDSTLVSGSYLCSKCATAMPGCELCPNSTSCLQCESGFYLDSTSKLCSLCQVKLTGCVYCQSNGSACTLCDTGYFLSSLTKKCALCSTVQTGCEICNQTPSGQFTCIQAKSGFYLQNMGTTNQASICNASYCDVCIETDPSKCITCESAFYLDSSAQVCIACEYNLQACLTCENSILCTSCQSGYFLDSNNQCSKCTSKFDNCYLCNQSKCLKCKSLYILDPVTSGCQTCFQKFPGCKYCNQTNCLYCSSNFYQSGNGCQPCDTINGCLACENSGVCLKCKQNYFQDNTTKACNLCSSVMVGCFGCESQTYCVLCQSGYMLNDNKTCTKLTSSNSSIGNTNSSVLKLVTEYINKNLLRHSLYSKAYDFAKVDLSNNISQIQLFMAYTSTTNSSTIKEQLTILNYEWSTSDSKTLFIDTNNPLNVASSKMSMFRRLLQTTTNGSISLESTTVIVSISQPLAQQILPQALMVGDSQVQYDLNNAEFYASYLKQTSMTMWQFIVFGYLVIVFLLINYTIRSFWTDKSVDSDHGEMIPHYLSFAAPALIIYPTTVELLSFCYGFMLLNFPWANDSLGRLLGNTFDTSPEVTKIFYANLNVGSTYAIALIVILILVVGGYSIISICYSQRDEKPKQQNKSIFFSLVYNMFSYGALFTATLAVQGCFMNPINELLSFQNIANSLFYVLGIVILFLIFVDLFHSLCINPTKYFYKLRNLLKTILLSLSYLNPTYFFSVLVIMDFLFVAGEYFISKKQNSKGFAFSWIIKNIALNVGLILLVFISNKLTSVLVSIGLILLSVALEIYEHCKLGEERRRIAKLRIGHNEEYQRAAERTIHTELNDEGRQRNNNGNIWNIQTSPEVNLAELIHTPINEIPANQSSRKNSVRNEQNMTSIDTIFQSTDYEPRRRRDRKRDFMKNTVSTTLNGFKGLTRDPSEKVMHVKKRDRYDGQDENIERISNF